MIPVHVAHVIPRLAEFFPVLVAIVLHSLRGIR
jgi:hypothetical protein